MKIVALFILVLIVNTAISQTTQFTPAMINTLGGSGDVGAIHYDFTVGEPVILFGGTGCDSIFSGFQHSAEDSLRIKKVNVSLSGPTTFCLHDSVKLTAPAGVSYLWNNGSTTQFIWASQSGNYHVRVTNSCGDTINSNIVTVTTLDPPVPQICMVTIDSLSEYNVIMWEKPISDIIHSYLIYRDTANNAYGLIGEVPYDSLGMFTDTARTIYAANGDPNYVSWRYKIAVKDTCDNISNMSPYHQTIFLQHNGGNFSWSEYKIEGQPLPVPALTNYLFQRDNLSNGNFITIATLGAFAISSSDPNYSTYQDTATWRIITNWSITCTPTKANTHNSTRSNVQRNYSVLNVALQSLENNLKIYPNPSSGKFTIQINDLKLSATNCQLSISNIQGKSIYQSVIINTKSEIDISNQPSGLYIISVNTGEKVYHQKLVKE